MSNDEIDQIKQRYDRRKEQSLSMVQNSYSRFVHSARSEREWYGTSILRKKLGQSIAGQSILEIGAGHGDNVHFFHRAGFDWNKIFLNELLEDRVESLKSWFPNERIYPGNILDLENSKKFNVITQFTVFSSILDKKLRQKIVNWSSQHLCVGGYFLWYDFCFDNPKNKDVNGISKKEARLLFSRDFDLVYSQTVTLLPPLARRIGFLYGFFNFLFPFLRTHQVLLFRKRDKN